MTINSAPRKTMLDQPVYPQNSLAAAVAGGSVDAVTQDADDDLWLLLESVSS